MCLNVIKVGRFVGNSAWCPSDVCCKAHLYFTLVTSRVCSDTAYLDSTIYLYLFYTISVSPQVSVYLQNWSHVLSYVSKAESTPEIAEVRSCFLTCMSFPFVCCLHNL